METIRLKPGRLLRRLAVNLPDTHPDAWVKPPRATMVPEATYEGEGIVGGVRCLFFCDPSGQRWAQPIVSRGWDEGVGAPTNAAPHEDTHVLLAVNPRAPGWKS